MTLSPTTSAPTDEDTFVFPDAWLRYLHPRRGGAPGKAFRLDRKAPAATDALVAEARTDWLDEALRKPTNDKEAVEHIRRMLDGEPTPLGAAGLALAAGYGNNGRTAAFADAWMLRHGIEFAAVAAVQTGELFVWPHDRAPVHKRGHGHRASANLALLRRMRAALAVCSDLDYTATVTTLVAAHANCVSCLAACAYLVPTETEQVAQACREHSLQHAAGQSDLAQQAMLQAALSTAEQVDALGEEARLSPFAADLGTCVTMIDGLGPDAAALFVECLGDNSFADAKTVRAIGSIVSRIPGETPLRTLMDRLDRPYLNAAVQEAIARFPVRSLGMLAEAASRPQAKNTATALELLQRHVLRHRDLAESEAGNLAAPHAAIVDELLSRRTAAVVPAEPPESLPALLASPPWTRPVEVKPRTEPKVVAGLLPPMLARVEWTAKELETAARSRLRRIPPWNFEEVAARVAQWEQDGIAEQQGDFMPVNLFTFGAVEPNRELIRKWRPTTERHLDSTLWPLLQRFEVDAIPALVYAARRVGPAAAGDALLPALDIGSARLMAEWIARLKSGRKRAEAWFARHGADAAALLVPDAVDAPGKPREYAEAALRHLAGSNVPDLAELAERRYGADAAEAVRAILAEDAAALASRVKPALPDWIDPAALPQVLLRGGESALPPEAARHLAESFSLSTPRQPFPGLREALEILDRASTAEFCWQLFLAWRTAGHPAPQSWALTALGLVGNDETATLLTPVIRAWPGESGHHRAVAGLDVLAGIGTDHALQLLNEIAQRSQFKALKDTAVRKVSEIAAQRGLTGEQLADRLVPDLGLDPEGGLWLDYGPRRFRVGFDEQLKPFVADEAGRRRKDLPAPNSKDDADLAAAARTRLTALKKQARSVAADQIRRLEAALVEQRAWTADEFAGLLLAHPLLRHVVRRLLWVSELDGTREGFRVAEDESLADVADHAFVLPAAASVRLAHPLTWPEGLTAWGEVFADYEILQPFRQLDREVFALTAQERATYRLARFEGRTVPVGRILGLTAHGWRRSPAMDNGIENCVTRRLDADRYLVIDLDDGIPVGAVAEDWAAEQTLVAVYLSAEAKVYHAGREDSGLRFADLDPLCASELLGQLTRLVD